MEKKIYKKIKQDYNYMYKFSKHNYYELRKLEKSSIIRKYKHLLKLKKLSQYLKCTNSDKSNIIHEIINMYSYGAIRKTNNILYPYLEITVKEYEEIYNCKLDKKCKDSIIVIYLDIENSKKQVIIDLTDKENFEANNKIVKGDESIPNFIDRYYNLKYEFFKLCLYYDQDLALKQIMGKENSKEKMTTKIKKL